MNVSNIGWDSPMIEGENLSFVILALEARIHKALTLVENVDPRLKAEDDGEEGSLIIARSCAREPPNSHERVHGRGII
ncbi:hypothetical protein QE435_002196 [Rhizobium sp. SORGH_AS 787]|nr:hypothetical protein [Rhizobium sp. SORGH_AS_0787]